MTALHPSTRADSADPATVAEAVGRRTGERVRVHETHGSVVFVSGERAFKLRKPERFDFADLRRARVRRELALADADLQEPLAPHLVVGALDVVSTAGGVDLAPVGAPDPLDVVVEMRRYDEQRSMRTLLATGEIGEVECRAVGRRVAEFHRQAARIADPPDVRAMVDRNLEAVLPLLDELLPARDRFALQRLLDAFLFAWEEPLAARASAGLVIDGHGDLRAEHVLLQGGRIDVVDRLEFSDLRRVDIADELAFLLMELFDATGDHALGSAVLDGYREGGGTVPPTALLAFFGVHRALVRAKVALLRAGQVPVDAADDHTAQAFHLASVARRLAWRARGRMFLLVTGPPASGKSTLARALGESAGVPVISSDVVRAATNGGATDYSLEGRASIYSALALEAGRHHTCIIDATFGDEAFQRAFLMMLPRERRQDLLVVRCYAPLEERVARAQRRAETGIDPSEAGADIVRSRAADGDDARAMFPGTPSLAIDTQAPLPVQVDLLESWLDTRLAGSGE